MNKKEVREAIVEVFHTEGYSKFWVGEKADAVVAKLFPSELQKIKQRLVNDQSLTPKESAKVVLLLERCEALVVANRENDSIKVPINKLIDTFDTAFPNEESES